MSKFKLITDGLVKNNPTFVLLLGMCPTLATTTSAINGLGMGLTTTVVLMLSNIIISALRNIIPDKVRIPAFIVIIASFVTIVGQFLEAYLPALNSALGMFIPLELNVPLVVGGAVNWYVTTRSKDETTNKERGEKGNLIASGFIAGGALMGVISALLRFGGIQFDYAEWWSNPLSELLSLLAYILLIIYFVRATKK